MNRRSNDTAIKRQANFLQQSTFYNGKVSTLEMSDQFQEIITSLMMIKKIQTARQVPSSITMQRKKIMYQQRNPEVKLLVNDQLLKSPQDMITTEQSGGIRTPQSQIRSYEVFNKDLSQHLNIKESTQRLGALANTSKLVKLDQQALSEPNLRDTDEKRQR